jgi:hypothetical protein
VHDGGVAGGRARRIWKQLVSLMRRQNTRVVDVETGQREPSKRDSYLYVHFVLLHGCG